MASKLSTRSRNLSQRRRNNIMARGEGHDLSVQDAPLNDGSSWVAHRGELDDDEEDEEDEDDEEHLDAEGLNGEGRGRTKEAIVA